MVDMSKEEAWKMYEEDALSGVHPDDREYVARSLDHCIKEKKEKYESAVPVKKGNR